MKHRHIHWFPLSHPEKILFWSSTVWLFADGLLGPLFAVYTQRVGGDIFSITWAWAAFLVVTAVGTIYAGRYADAYNVHEELAVIGYAVTTVCAFAYIGVTTPWQLFAVQVGLGAGLALSNPTWYALYDRYANARESGTTWALSTAGGQIAQACAILLGGVIVTYGSFTALFVLMGCIFALSTLIQARLLVYKKRHL